MRFRHEVFLLRTTRSIHFLLDFEGFLVYRKPD
jgi:hypothetical protein